MTPQELERIRAAAREYARRSAVEQGLWAPTEYWATCAG